MVRIIHPVRLQLSRKKGFDLQALSRATNGLSCVNVARPTMWGNPFTFNRAEPGAQARAVKDYRSLFTRKPSLIRHQVLTVMRGNQGHGEAAVMKMRDHLSDLRGKNLACWCKPGEPCHADMLLEIANR